MAVKPRITEYLDIDLDKEMWCCHVCGRELISARDNYKKGCLVYERDPKTVYLPKTGAAFDFPPSIVWSTYVEFYCPDCGTMICVEALPQGHPVTYDIELDIEKLKEKHLGKK